MTYLPFTLDPYTPIPEDAPLSSGMTDAQAEQLQAISEAYTAETAVGVSVSSSAPFVLDVLLEPAQPFADGFTVQWQFGDGVELGADDLDQHYTYPGPGVYRVTAYVQQPGEATFAVSTTATFDAAGLLVEDQPEP